MTEMNEKAKKFWVLALASIASCMVALDALVVTTALSSIRVGLGASGLEVGFQQRELWFE